MIHTPEPWYDLDSQECTHGGRFFRGFDCPWRQISDDDYHRALVCVNALAGVPTAFLESLPENALAMLLAKDIKFTIESFSPDGLEIELPEEVESPATDEADALEQISESPE